MPRIAPALVLALATFAAGCRPETPVPPGDIAAQLAMPSSDGSVFDPTTLRGKPALVVFWRPGCPHCLAELPEAARAAAERGVPAIAVQVAGNPDTGRAVLEKLAWTGTAIVDDGRLRTNLKIKAVPLTLVLRADGTARKAMVGRQSYDALLSALK